MASRDGSELPRHSRIRGILVGALVVLGAAFAGAILGTVAFLAVLHDPMGMPVPAEPAPGNEGWALMMNMFVGGLGAAIGGALGALVGLGFVIARAWQRRTD